MTKLSINLLPKEVLAQEHSKNRISLINQISFGFLIILVSVTTTVLMLRLLQNRALYQDKVDLENTVKDVESLKKQEGLLTNLKKRIDSINTWSKQESKQLSSFTLMLSLKPANIKTNFLGLDKSGNISYSGESSSAADLKTLFDNVVDPKLTEGRIAKVKVENLNRSITDKYRFDLTLTLK